MNPTTMPFGKHRGTAVADLPRHYLRWLVGNIDPARFPAVVDAARATLIERGDGPSLPRPKPVPAVHPGYTTFEWGA